MLTLPRTLRLVARPLVFAGFGLLLLSGCKRLHVGSQDYVYVVSQNTYLRDRLAVVANHVANVHNGEKLAVVQRTTRFYKVRTDDGKEGWLEEHLVIDQGEFDKFEALKQGHANAPVVAEATLSNEIYLHLLPGRKTEHFYVLPANDKLQLLERASVPKPLPPQAAVLTPKLPRPRKPADRPAGLKKPASGSTIWAQAPVHPDRYTAPDLDPAQPWMSQPMEDWWLVRDSAGHVGWILARAFDVTVPDEVAQYSEGRRIVGAYLLNTVMDDGMAAAAKPEEGDNKKTKKPHHPHAKPAASDAADAGDAAQEGAPAATPHPVGQYVTVTAEYKSGLPFDWDQVRVFIWNTHKHRYETAYRLRDLHGYLPLTIGKENIDKMGEEPTFTIRTSPDGDVTPGPDGTFHPKRIDVTQYRLEGGIVRRDTPLPARPDAPVVPEKHPQKVVPARNVHLSKHRRGGIG